MRQRPEYDMKLIGRNLRRLRESKKLSVEEVRKYLCLGSVQAVYKYEKGIGYPPADAMFALMQLYEADLEDIIGNHEWKQYVSSFAYVQRGKVVFQGNLIWEEEKEQRRFNSLMRRCELYKKYTDKVAAG